MILGWMAYSILFGGLCALAAHALESAARVIGKPSRWIWFAAMAATLGISMMAMYTAVVGATTLIPRRRGASWLDGPSHSKSAEDSLVFLYSPRRSACHQGQPGIRSNVPMTGP